MTNKISKNYILPHSAASGAPISDDDFLEYIPITQTLTRIRVKNRPLVAPPSEIVCYPITSISRPLDLFGPFPKAANQFVPVQPPAPPSRRSSKRNTTLKIFSQQSKAPLNKSPETIRSKSVGNVLHRSTSFSASLKEEKNYANHSRVARKQIHHHRVASLSPIPRSLLAQQAARKSSASPIAFGRSISRERTFAEEKKRLEQQHSLCRRGFTASTSILRNPDLKSPDEVKRAIKTTFQMPYSSASAQLRSYSTERLSRNAGKGSHQQLSVSTTRNSQSSLTANKKSSVVTTSKRTSSRESKFAIQKNKKFNGSAGNVSLARTSSTYSIDSVVSSKKKVDRPLILTQPRTSTSYYPVSVAKVKKLKKTVSRESLDQKKPKAAEPKITTSKDVVKKSETKHTSRSDKFFQKLFLRDMIPPPPSKTLVQERAEVWDNLVAATNPVAENGQRAAANIYLTQKRAVTDSKFKTMDEQFDHSAHRQSRSLSPRAYRKSDFLWFNQSSSVYLSSDNEEFGSSNGSTVTDGRGKICFTEVHEPNTPIVIHGTLSTTTTTQFRSNSPQTIRPTRSPACRRIQSLRATQKTDHRAQPNRARSLGSAVDQSKPAMVDPSAIQSRSCYSLDVNNYENHNRLCSHQKSERFRELEQFYSNLERVGQLEKATSSTDLRPIRKEGDIIDFDEWQQMRSHEKAEKELTQLVGKLRVDEKAKDLLFRPKYHEDHKWNERQDSGLRTREKSVEDLKEILMEKSLLDDGGSELKLQQDVMAKGQYKSFWRGKSVNDVASHMVGKYNPKSGAMTLPSHDRRFGLSKKLISTLSRDQVNKLKHQLSEIYCNNFASESAAASNDDSHCHIEVRAGDDRGSGLTVRSNSLVFKEELLGQAKLRESYKADSIGSIPEPRVSRSVDRYEDRIRKEQKLSESEKKSILQNLSKELHDKFQQRRQNQTDVVRGKEVRGAIASNIARNTLPKVDKKQRPKIVKTDHPLKVVTPKDTAPANSMNENDQSQSDPKSEPKDGISKKIVNQIEYFENKRDELPETTIYQAYSSPDEEEIMKVIDQKMRIKAAAEKRNRSPIVQQGLSSSVSDFKEIFGETAHQIVSNNRTTSPTKFSNTTSIESVFRSRSVSPLYHFGKAKFVLNPAPVRSGDVQKIKDKFESLNYQPLASISSEEAPPPIRRFQSDPELTKRQPSPSKIGTSELGDVSWITHKFETKNNASRGRCRQRKVCSPIPSKAPLTLTDLRMPHIDIISKTASLRLQMRKSKSPTSTASSSLSPPHRPVAGGDVKRIKSKFENAAAGDCSILGQMYTSSPDISQLRDISSYLSGPWTAHKYPNREDNSLSPVQQQQKGAAGQVVVKRRTTTVRPSSASPPRNRIATILKPFYRMNGGIGGDDDHLTEQKKKRRAQDKRAQADLLYRKLQSRIVPRKPTVKFEGFYIRKKVIKCTTHAPNIRLSHINFQQNSSLFQ